MATDIEYMQRALALAEQGRGRTSPNPMVGCVIVRDSHVIGEGYHVKAGEPHAEVNAVHAAKNDIAGSTIYVTLEPCSHEGRTPPCAPFLVKHKPERVVVAMPDPNPKVSGEGIFQIREAGISVDVGVLEDDARQLNEVYIKYITTRIPFVIAKCAMTLDGKIATRTGDSQWVTNEESRQFVHELRNTVDAVLVGSRTVMLDDPQLTTRLKEGKIKDPIRIVLDAGDYLDSDRRIFHSDSKAPTWIAVPDDREFDEANETLHIPAGKGGLDMARLMHELGARDVTSVLIEGGGTTLASAFEAGVVDKVLFFIAPKIVGGKDAVTPVEGDGVALMKDAIPIGPMTVRMIGNDILIEAYVMKD